MGETKRATHFVCVGHDPQLYTSSSAQPGNARNDLAIPGMAYKRWTAGNQGTTPTLCV